MSFDTCPKCQYTEVSPTQKSVTNVMNKYKSPDGKEIILNDGRDSLEIKGVIYTKVITPKEIKVIRNPQTGEVIPDKPVAPIDEKLIVPTGLPVYEQAGNDKTGVAKGASVKGLGSLND